MKRNVVARNVGTAVLLGVGVIASRSESASLLWLITVISTVVALQPWQLRVFLQPGRRVAPSELPEEAQAPTESR